MERPFGTWLTWTRFTPRRSGPGLGSEMREERDHWKPAITKFWAGLIHTR